MDRKVMSKASENTKLSDKKAMKELRKWNNSLEGSLKDKIDMDKQAEGKPEVRSQGKYYKPAAIEDEITAERLKEAVIWSEILGKPVSKRGKSRLSWR